MSITTGFLTTPTGSNNTTSNQDLGSIFVAQNSSTSFTNTYSNCTITTSGTTPNNIPLFTQLFFPNPPYGSPTSAQVTFNTAGTYLLCISSKVLQNGNANTAAYSIALAPVSVSLDNTVSAPNISIATPQFIANDSHIYTQYPTSNTTILNVTTTGTYGVYYYLYYGDISDTSAWYFNLTITAFFLTPYSLPTINV